jgi:hypothetical protein
MKYPLMVLALIALLSGPALAQRNIDGSYVELLDRDPLDFVPGDSYVCDFYVYNGSADVEWIMEVSFLFPDCFQVNSGWYVPDSGASGPWSFQFDTFGSPNNGALFYDANGGYGEIYAGEGGHFYVEVLCGGECECGEETIQWFLQGDGYGSDPHDLTDFIDITVCDNTSMQQSNWSSIKSLY